MVHIYKRMTVEWNSFKRTCDIFETHCHVDEFLYVKFILTILGFKVFSIKYRNKTNGRFKYNLNLL